MKLLPRPKRNMYTLKHLRDLQKKEGLSLEEGLKVVSKSCAQDRSISLSTNLSKAVAAHGLKVEYK